MWHGEDLQDLPLIPSDAFCLFLQWIGSSGIVLFSGSCRSTFVGSAAYRVPRNQWRIRTYLPINQQFALEIADLVRSFTLKMMIFDGDIKYPEGSEHLDQFWICPLSFGAVPTKKHPALNQPKVARCTVIRQWHSLQKHQAAFSSYHRL